MSVSYTHLAQLEEKDSVIQEKNNQIEERTSPLLEKQEEIDNYTAQIKTYDVVLHVCLLYTSRCV